MAPTHTPVTGDAIESIDMTTTPPSIADSIKDSKLRRPGISDEEQPQTVQPRSTLKMLSIMTALFVSHPFSDKHSIDPYVKYMA